MLNYIHESYTHLPPASVSFRIAQDIDLPVIDKLHDTMWHQVHRGFAPHQIEGSPEYARSLWPKGPLGVRMIAEQGGEIIGFGVGGPAQTIEPHADTEIHALYIQPSLRFRGIGTALLMSLAQQLAIQSGAQRTGLSISAIHVGAVAFARALGAVVKQRAAAQLAITNGNLLAGNPTLALVWNDINQLAYQAQTQRQPKWLF